MGIWALQEAIALWAFGHRVALWAFGIALHCIVGIWTVHSLSCIWTVSFKTGDERELHHSQTSLGGELYSGSDDGLHREG